MGSEFDSRLWKDDWKVQQQESQNEYPQRGTKYENYKIQNLRLWFKERRRDAGRRRGSWYSIPDSPTAHCKRTKCGRIWEFSFLADWRVKAKALWICHRRARVQCSRLKRPNTRCTRSHTLVRHAKLMSDATLRSRNDDHDTLKETRHAPSRVTCQDSIRSYTLFGTAWPSHGFSHLIH